MDNDQKEVRNPLLKHEITALEMIAELLKTDDLTAEGSTHVINLVAESVKSELQKAGFLNLTVVRDNPVVSVENNFDKLLFPSDSLDRSSVYTRYVDKEHVLRTHTSASIPSLMEQMVKCTNYGEIEDITFVLPGLVFRRDISDKTHLGVFHQMDVWRIVRHKDGRPMDSEDLLKMVRAVFTGAISEDVEPVIYPANRPYTVNGIEVYTIFGDDELEVLKAGLINPWVLKNCGLSPNEYSGLVLGMGLDRLVMAKKRMDDIRHLRATNPRIACQMYDMLPYEKVSSQPPLIRDLSYVVPVDYQPEDVADNLRVAFRENSYLIENISILSETQIGEMHPNAVERLGICDGQKNVLVRVILCHPDRTLTTREGSVMYGIAYPLVHHGKNRGYV